MKTRVLHKNNRLKVGRNDPCPCGSGLKYKKCCLGKKNPLPGSYKEDYYKKYKIRLKEKADIEGIKAAGRLALATLDLVESEIRPGMTTEEINTLVHDFTVKNGEVMNQGVDFLRGNQHPGS